MKKWEQWAKKSLAKLEVCILFFLCRIRSGPLNPLCPAMSQICPLAVPFDSRFASIRRQETNVGNFVCDIVRSYTHADFVLLNSGTFRADAVGLSVSLIVLMPSLSTCYSFCS